MKITSFIGSLGSLFRRNELAQSCQAEEKKISSKLLPEVHHAADLFKVKPGSSAAYKNVVAACRRATGQQDLFVVINKGLTNALLLLELVEKESEKLFAEEEATLALNFKKATYAQMVASITFAGDYTLKLLNWLMANETMTDVREQYSQADIDYVVTSMEAYFQVIDSLSRNVKSIEKMINDLPEVPVNERSEAAIHNSLGVKADPLMLNRLVIPYKISVKYNPFYLIGTMIADWQVRSYKATEEELRLLQMRRLRLEKMRASQEDPRLEAEIEHISSRVTQLTYELQTAKEKFDV